VDFDPFSFPFATVMHAVMWADLRLETIPERIWEWCCENSAVALVTTSCAAVVAYAVYQFVRERARIRDLTNDGLDADYRDTPPADTE
jgi:hypothetical protein